MIGGDCLMLAGEPHGDRAPAPFDSAEFEDHRRADKMKLAAYAGEEEEAGMITRGPVDDARCIGQLATLDPVDAADEENSIPAPDHSRDSEVRSPRIDVTEAYVVHGEVVHATPLRAADLRAADPPAEVPYIWWKQPNAKRCLALNCLVATASIVALSVYFSKNDSEPGIKMSTEVESIAASAPPSASTASTAPPSISPSATAPAVALGVFFSNNVSEPGIEASIEAASITASVLPSASVSPTALPSISPSPTSFPTPSCINCNNIRTPWMTTNKTECTTAPDWIIERNCINDLYWVNNRYCEKRCQDDGYGYHGVPCCPCVACSNVPTPWMINNETECATASNRFIEENCIKDSFWVNNRFCERRCQDDGYGYHGIPCCTSSD